ncbi:hypothetical protein ACTXT7_014632 [Hymenolepis weldensis]
MFQSIVTGNRRAKSNSLALSERLHRFKYLKMLSHKWRTSANGITPTARAGKLGSENIRRYQ